MIGRRLATSIAICGVILLEIRAGGEKGRKGGVSDENGEEIVTYCAKSRRFLFDFLPLGQQLAQQYYPKRRRFQKREEQEEPVVCR